MRSVPYNISSCLKKSISLGILSTAFTLFFITDLSATHIVGGNMYYKCLGNEMYEITLIIRRDCIEGADDAPHDAPEVYLSIFDGNGLFYPRRGENGHARLSLIGLDTLDSDLDKFCIDEGQKVCISEATYRGVVCLPFDDDGYIISYQRCCRNGTLTNIEDPLETGGTWLVNISPDALRACNSNPVFNSWPPVYVCLNDALVYDHSATDPDGDSLVYELCTPYLGATIDEPRPGRSDNPPYDSVTWKSPYSRADMMGGVPLRIDKNTGLITATPDLIGQFLIGIVVKEYRNGQLIGSSKRDFEFNVRACGDKPDALFDVLTTKCDGLKQIFQNQSMGATKYTWYFDYPNQNITSNEVDPMHTYDSIGTYTVVLIAENDQGCKDSVAQTIEVLNPMLVPDFEIDLDCQDSLKISLINNSTSKDSIVSYSWEVSYPGGTLTSMEHSPMFVLTEGGKVTVRLTITDINGCSSSTEKNITVNELPLDFIQDSFDICLGDEVRLLENGDPNLIYNWSPTDGLKLNPSHDPRACPQQSTTYCVTVTDGVCSRSGCVYVEVTDTIVVSIVGPDSTCNGEVSLMAMLDTVIEIEWALDPNFDDIIGTGDKLNYNINSTTTFYVRAGGDIKCPGRASKTVVSFDAVVENLDRNPIICFGPGMVELNPGGNEDYLYNWTPGKYLDDSTIANPKAMVDSTTIFNVIIVNPEHPDCPDTIDVKVSVGDSLEIFGLPQDTILCDADSLKLSVTTSPEDLEVTWCDPDGNQIAKGKNVSIDPVDLDYIVVKATDTLDCTVRDTISITLYELDIEIIAPDSICNGDTGMIMIVNNGNDSLEIEWFPLDKIFGSNRGSVIKILIDTTTTFTAVITNNKGCTWERTVTVNVGGFFESIEVTADPPVINPGESTQLYVNIDGAVTYMWTGEGLDDPTIQDPIATINEPGTYTYTVKVTDEMGCMIFGSVTVEVRTPNCIDGVFIPNAFSPNGDSHNDLLYVRSFFIQDMNLKIFNRWGEMVFETDTQSTPWDGTYKGNALPPDVYGYILEYRCIDGEDYVKKGNITLLR